jgi:hypothetical protein
MLGQEITTSITAATSSEIHGQLSGGDQEAKSSLPADPPEEAKLAVQNVVGQAAAAKRNRQREVRLSIIDAFVRLRIPFHVWPDFVQAYYTDPHQQNKYRQLMTPSSFHAPDFDRLNQSPDDWIKEADRAWALHRNTFLDECGNWVKAGVDEEIVEAKRPRGPGKKMPVNEGVQRRGDNTPIERRYEWAAKYLARVALKEIAGEDACASTAGRIARQIVRSAGWVTKSR